MEDAKLSWRAKGLLAYMLTLEHLPYRQRWGVCIPELIDYSSNRRKYINSGLKELEDRGYIVIYKNCAENNRRNDLVLVA